ncbi:cytochrome c oxidase assembly protein [Pseudoxanthomonas kalamensis DSM 18571]|uniref:cytochrome c oxidase assembly protein n=1 Tax=Pseudoxanthomonas kalamensis TaxID=289483 RepID=UPI001391331A|nr:cytochrome c oxidase assembly protein [Pseudoxanthomonas kalamensis]KAF1712163.1 cytochrome c oxidase assembly protein [Pseudoxanthomonas kalamensis DSM 18571]
MSEVRANTAGLGRLVAVALGVFVLSFSLVPLYRIACEKVFGIRLDNTAADAAGLAAAVPAERMVTVEFDSGVNSKLPWSFHPNQTRMQVKVGELYETTYYAHNDSDRAIVGSATPSVAPARASGHFIKTECFCFTAQTLQAGETRDMPVRFMIDRDLPADVNTVTLSYMFYKNDTLTSRLDAGAGASTASPHAAP